jgi:hypothetical protein
MVSQLQRSVTRKKLTSLCSDAIIELLTENTSLNTNATDMNQEYLSALKITLGNAVEAITGKIIPDNLTHSGEVLSMFASETKNIEKYSTLKSISKVRTFIGQNKNTISEEDLGGVSELFTGHKAIWNEEKVHLVHNPARRDAGKIYTPYDVTDFMCSIVAKEMVSKSDNVSDLFRMKVLDPAVGSGAFCAQFVRKLWAKASRKWKLKNEDEFRNEICKNMIYSSDIDEEALELAKVVLWISAGSPSEGIRLNMANCDSLEVGSCKDIAKWEKHTSFETLNGYDVVFGNPPYVRVKPEKLNGFDTNRTRNLYCAFTELAVNLLNENGLLCYIVPQSIVGSKETLPLRNLLMSQKGSLRFQVFDSVPDFLFDQGKIESNTNTNINQRTAIITLNRNAKDSIYTSPLLRWRRREERDSLFRNLSQIRITKSDIHDGLIPMLENRQDLILYRKLKSQKQSISDAVVKEGGRLLYIPKAIRYFITAVPFDLGRPNTILLRVSEEYYESIHSILNSNLFYWWWRINGNGFQVEKKDILSFPLLLLNEKLARKFSKSLDDSVDECRVFKSNAGKQIPNINYNYKQELLQAIDKALLETIDLEIHERIFGCKTNSLFGKMNALRGYMTDMPRPS